MERNLDLESRKVEIDNREYQINEVMKILYHKIQEVVNAWNREIEEKIILIEIQTMNKEHDHEF